MGSFQMTDLEFEIINGPLVILNVFTNIFFAFCLIFPLHGRKELKQPLKMLLGSLVCCTILYLISLTAWYFARTVDVPFKFFFVSYLVVSCTLNTSMSSSAWLNFFYYTQIVPARRAFFIWVKRNIKSIIYCALFVDRMFYLFDMTVSLFIFFLPIKDITTNNSSEINSTAMENRANKISDGLRYASYVFYIIGLAYTLAGLCLMIASNIATVHHLHRHIRSMSVSGSPFSSPRLQSQVRVTVTAILQGVFYLFVAVWFFTYTFSWLEGIYDFDDNMFYTGISFYISGTTVNLAVGHALFRERIAKIILSLHCCKAT